MSENAKKLVLSTSETLKQIEYINHITQFIYDVITLQIVVILQQNTYFSIAKFILLCQHFFFFSLFSILLEFPVPFLV